MTNKELIKACGDGTWLVDTDPAYPDRLVLVSSWWRNNIWWVGDEKYDAVYAEQLRLATAKDFMELGDD